MPEAEKQAAQESAKRAGAGGKNSQGFTDAERAAMRARAKEQRSEAGRGRRAGKADGEGDVLAAIAAMTASDRAMAERIHAIVEASAPELMPKTWYGMPAYAKDNKVVCFFQSAGKFNTRYATLGFNEAAHLDEGEMWPVAYALTALTDEVEARIAALVKRAVG